MEKTARRPSGITRRWMRNTVLLVIAIAVISAAAVSLSVAGYYRENVRTGLMAKARTSADFFSNYVTRSWAEYYDSAYRYTESFEDADRLELQFVNVQGFVETSSYGVTAGASVGTPDVAQAVETGEICSWRGRNPATGERILSVSAPMRYSDDRIIGVMRFVTSMRLVDRAALQSALVVSAVALAVVLVIILTSLYFIRSVVTPIGEITHVVRRVADGSYGARIQKQYPDEIGELVDSINEMSVKISQSEKAQTEFVSSVSHELRTPLTAITGWAETIAYDDQLNDDTRRGVGIILREARRLTKMVEELLEFTRMQDGRFTLNIEDTDVEAELEDTIFTYRELLRQENMSLEYTPSPEPLPTIPADPERLKQVFLNILDNARKYGRDGKRILASAEREGQWLILAFRDFGPGIPEDDLENVKKKFYKGNSKERGSGIGLAVCDEIVKYHGGRLVLQNAEGGGLRVTVLLPVNQEGSQ